ncbi:MAG TPA: AI-2E family transporter [Blastocatellia bacterium]|nr:AI-2E family transporter [Blastocatellia bacterium]
MAISDHKRLTELTVGEAGRMLVYALISLLAFGLLVALLGRLLIALLLGVVAAVYLLPVQKWLERHLRVREGSALVTIALIVLPLAAVTVYSGVELSGYSSLAEGQRERIIADISRALSKYLPVAPESTRVGLEAAFAEAVARSVETIQALRQQTPLLLASLTLFFFTVYYVLTHRVRLGIYLKLRVPGEYLPFYERLTENIGGALRGALRAVLIDQTLKAMVILLLNLIFGVPLAVVLGVVTFLIGFFPLLGEWAVYIPVSVYLLVFRHEPASAAIYLGTGITMTVCSSLLLRPRLASGSTRQFNFYWMLVALVAGVYSFGIPGVVLGPAILGFVKAVIETLTGRVRADTSLLVTEIRQEAGSAPREPATEPPIVREARA